MIFDQQNKLLKQLHQTKTNVKRLNADISLLTTAEFDVFEPSELVRVSYIYKMFKQALLHWIILIKYISNK